VLSWAFDNGHVPANPCEKGGRLYSRTRVDRVWTEDDEARFLTVAPAHLHLALMLALWTGQRKGDLIRLPWSACDGTHIRLTPRKSVSAVRGRRGVRLVIKVGVPLKAALDEAAKAKKSPVILLNSDGRPWKEDGFRTAWRRTCKDAGITGLTFNDLRGTAVTRLALAGCTEPEITAITAHSMADVRSILRRCGANSLRDGTGTVRSRAGK